MLSTFTEAHIAAHSHSLLTYTMHQGRTGSSQNRRAEILPGGSYQYSPFYIHMERSDFLGAVEILEPETTQVHPFDTIP